MIDDVKNFPAELETDTINTGEKHQDGHELLRAFEDVFGYEAIHDLSEIYSSVWGCDAYRFKNQPAKSRAVNVREIFKALLDINEKHGSYISSELCASLRYARGTTTDENYMRQISHADIMDVADSWCNNLDKIEQFIPEAYRDTFYPRVWSEWNTYLGFIKQAREITLDFESDTFEGVTDKALNAFSQEMPGIELPLLKKMLSEKAHYEFEKADLVGLSVVFKIMRFPIEDIADWLQTGQWDELFYHTTRACLYGEGRFYQHVQMLLGLAENKAVKEDFNELLSLVRSSLQADYRIARDPHRVDFESLFLHYHAFRSKHGAVTISITDYDDCQLVFRQQKLRQAEEHLLEVERSYSQAGIQKEQHTGDAVKIYRNAMAEYVHALENERVNTAQLTILLSTFRQKLLSARRISDAAFGHAYYFWTGAGDDIGQVKSRSLHPRAQLYQVEAYAERMYLAGKIVLKKMMEETIDAHEVWKEYLRTCEMDERPLYVQEWITHYGPRRPAIFGFEPVKTIHENDVITDLDQWVYSTRQWLLQHGQQKELWGHLATGYTEQLRYLLKPGNGFETVGREVLQHLLDTSNLKDFYTIIKKVNPYDHRCDVSSQERPAFITAGLHMHNVKPVVFFETMVHLRELNWPTDRKWCLAGTTTSQVEFAKMEHAFALELGISRLGIVNRQLLKGGNQNRIIPNVPRATDGAETFYLTLDDDYVVSPNTLHRLAAILYNKPDAGYSQTPLFFRAIYEPGHSIGRHLDGTMLLTWSTNVVPAFNDTSFYLPLGTGTLFRITPGKNDLDITGGFVVDPKTIMSGEDWAYGTVSMLMRFLPQQFAQTCTLPTEEIERRKRRKGYYITEDWVVGDGVDFAPGSQRQKARWNETCTRIFRSFWLPAILRHKGAGDMDSKSFHLVNHYMIASWLSHILSPIVFFIIPLLAFTPYGYNETAGGDWEYTAAYWAIFFCWIGARAYLRRPAYRLSGVPFFEVLDYIIMLVYGTFWSYFKTSITSFTTKPQYHWKTFKGKQNTVSLKIFHLCIGLFHLAAGIYSITRGSAAYSWYLLSGLIFIYVLRYHENAAANQKEKIAKISSDVRFGFRKKLSAWLSGQTGIPGYPIRVDKHIVLKTNAVIAGELLFFVFIIVSIRFFSSVSPVFYILLSTYLFLVAYMGYRRVLIQKEAFKNLARTRHELGAAAPEVILLQIKRLLQPDLKNQPLDAK